MAHYSLQLRNSTHVWDTVIVERDDHEALRIELARFVGELLRDHAVKIWEDQDWRVDVTDANGLIMYVMHVSASEAPSTMSDNALPA
ncbi:MAG TPA: hypothetical protein VM900_01890 [Sphingomonas sp.]|nr:hypothetical protein [Sphingomonas sp.]